MLYHLTVIAVCVLFGVAVAQPPEPNGRDAAAFGPRPAFQGRSGGAPANCRRQRFRATTGTCTHRFESTFAESRQPHFSYFDVDTTEFPETGLRSARVISNLVANQVEDVRNARGLNDLFVFFGQFIDHNVASTPLGDEEVDIEPPEGVDEELPFRRSLRVPTGEGAGERPLNVLTSTIDLAAVYGPNVERNLALRVDGDCRLKVSEGNLLPFNTEGFSNAPSADPEFYFAGDTRPNEHPVLTALHTLWLREHNYICDQIEPVFPRADAETLYEMARAINIAEFQKVSYEEFFPAITGRELPPYRGFRRRSNPTLSSVFSTAAFRVGHTIINEVITKISDDGTVEQSPLRENFFIPRNVEEDGIEPLLRGSAATTAQEVDVMVVDSLRNFLFQDVEDEEGPDLIALNLQRARDHHIPGFNAIRAFFDISPAATFADISSDPEVQAKLAAAYDSVDDVEAWIGMMAEDHMPNSSMGPTMFAVWREEFLRLRDGDQFFYLANRGLPRRLRNRLPELTDPIVDPNVNILQDIILRNSEITADELNSGSAFMTA